MNLKSNTMDCEQDQASKDIKTLSHNFITVAINNSDHLLQGTTRLLFEFRRIFYFSVARMQQKHPGLRFRRIMLSLADHIRNEDHNFHEKMCDLFQEIISHHPNQVAVAGFNFRLRVLSQRMG